MAKLFEYEGKQLLKKAGLPLPDGSVVSSQEAAGRLAEQLEQPVAIKAQVHAGGRGRAGAVKFAQSPAEARQLAADLLGGEVRGSAVREVLVEAQADIAQEYYLGIVIDSARDARCPLMVFSAQGGMEIEAVPDEAIRRLHVSPTTGLEVYQAVDFLLGAEVPPGLLLPLAQLCAKLVNAHRSYDCFTLEINPLAVTRSGELLCLDCKMEVDNAAVYRQPEMGIEVARDFGHEPTKLDLVGWGIEKADLRGSGFVMDMRGDDTASGYIGFHPIGGGSAMMAMDALMSSGLKPANYADTSGNPVASKIYRVAKVILSQPKIDGYLLAGFMMANQEQWHHGHAVAKALREELPKKPGLPCVLLVCGNKEEEALAILREGLAGVPGATRVEIYGRQFVTDTAFICGRMRALIEEYKAEQREGVARA